jgi:glycosyltransferase involved in cell wall biosynthesis
MLSALILTRNEEQDLPACLDSIAWCDDIHLLDSESTDNTRAIAESRGVHVTIRPFDTYAAQRNAGMSLSFKYPWVLVLDADERPTPELFAELQQAVLTAPPNVSAYRIRRRDFLWGTWLKHAQLTPLYIRLLRVGHARYTRDVNEIVEVDGQILDLHAPLDHLAFSKGITHWVAKHNQYSTMEAELLASGEATRNASLHQALFGATFHDRRVAQKAIFYEMPFRPLIKWLYMMFIRLAILDGAAGFMYVSLQSFYEFLIVIKHRELLRRRAGKTL